MSWLRFGSTLRVGLVITTALSCGSLVQAGAPGGKSTAPVVPGFERFHAAPDADAVRGGQLLLGELNCTSCHRAEPAQEAYVYRKQAPILDGVGGRIKAGYLRKFLADPQAVKPGTTMPHVVGGFDDKAEKVEALVHFLASTGTPVSERTDRKLIAAGRELYNKAGCAACHGSRDIKANPQKVLSTSVPLGDLMAKYSLASLSAFLENPDQVRPSGRMPGLLDGKESREVANYLLQALPYVGPPENTTYAYYEGAWDNLPDFTKLKPMTTGQAPAFDLSVARRVPEMALKFDGFIRIDKEGTYKFHLHSDDGSKLWINGKLVVTNDGVHAPQTKSGSVKLPKGVHIVVAGVFNLGGGVALGVDIEGPGLSRRDLGPLLMLTPEGNPKTKEIKTDDSIAPQAELIAKGRDLFASLGCANCHQMKQDGKVIEPTLTGPELSKLTGKSGCLEGTGAKNLPRYGLSAPQKTALAAALKGPWSDKKPSAQAAIAHTMTVFNCYACHHRDKIGGVEEDAQPFFVTTQPEMGDEGRIPPPLTGVGAKLTTAFLKHILANGAHDRPYMLTRMPKFGEANVGHLVDALQGVDKLEPVAKVTFADSPAKIKAEGRHMVGATSLGCIKCHTWAGNKAEGVQGIDMTILAQRLQREWFHRYLLDPNSFRPGTRMPAAWFGGVTPLPKVLAGDSPKQIEAIWVFLLDGPKAIMPAGVKKQYIPLIPNKEAIVYRNFIQGAGPRAIGVGYPEHLSLAFDANDMRLAMIWQGAFIDAKRHWTDRGVGFEPPAGDNVLNLPPGPSFAVLAKDDQAWPTKSAREQGYKFGGYRLTEDQRPTFLYSFNGVSVEDFPNAVHEKGQNLFRRTLTLSGDKGTDNLVYRAAVASKIEAAGPGQFRINGDWQLRIEAPVTPRIRQTGGQQELLVPVRIESGKARIVLEYQW